ncbi:MAG: hypothetical protein GF364_03185 [Candidatus Lokiarchaeota archaeon]|nr:hypothetical protein [Candidatus Lokiarchaeota archaeon]
MIKNIYNLRVEKKMLKIADGIEIETLTKPIIGKLHHAHCSSIVAFPDGELLAGWYHAITEANHNQKIYLSRKLKGETEWTEPVPMPDPSKTRFDGNPVLWIAPDTGLLWNFYNVGYGWSVCWAKSRTSKDRGHTWTKPKNVYPLISRGIKNPPILTSKGWYVLPAYVEFKFLRAVFFISKNRGKSWKQSRKVDLKPEIIPQGYEEKKGRQVEQPTLIEREDGSLFALCRNDGRPMKRMLQTESHDGGFTWTPAVNGKLPNPAGGFNMIKLTNGNVAIVYNHAPAPQNEVKWRNPLSIALSEDDGKTWQYRRNLLEWHPDENQETSQALKFEYPTLTEGLDNNIHITWSLSHPEKIDDKDYRFTDIQYTFVTEDWIKQRPYFEEAWELN